MIWLNCTPVSVFLAQVDGRRSKHSPASTPCSMKPG
jgi:hypothetical protein